MKISSDFLETSMPATGSEEESCCVMASLPCGFELSRRIGTFNRLFGLAMHDERRSSSVPTSTRASGNGRSVVRRRFADFSLRFEAREATCSIELESALCGNIQDTEAQERKKD